ncbi:hypothetical protein AVEN_262214-1 [Araneus ventricosus]|uniref:Uncharacterized protein n=1 Tax=Araneus ventricosus TaxID=182803 RepID=A0A4Y2WE06_ARAVE|nr:hypothetical protein AVEN_262214-1 [Araneus ventricosus]
MRERLEWCGLPHLHWGGSDQLRLDILKRSTPKPVVKAEKTDENLLWCVRKFGISNHFFGLLVIKCYEKYDQLADTWGGLSRSEELRPGRSSAIADGVTHACMILASGRVSSRDRRGWTKVGMI